MEHKVQIPVDLLHHFEIPGSLVSVEELKRGHINHTYVGVWSHEGVTKRYVHQIVNHEVFRNVPGLMNNMRIVTNRIRRRIADGEAQAGDTTLTIIPAISGEPFLVDEHGSYWRTFEYVENTVSFDVCPDVRAARESAAILGRFQRYIDDLKVSELCDTIPFFHDGEKRYQALEEALSKDLHSKRSGAQTEVAFAIEQRDLGGALVSALRAGKIPSRPAHHDMKLNNVLFEAGTFEARCLVDLDTCMPGTPLSDFGDLVRCTAVPCAEDETDLSKVAVDLELYQAITEGYLSEFGSILTPAERSLMSVAPRVLALILGVRFLTDHLLGDTYFRIHHPNHNLERARTQFEVVRALGRVEDEVAGWFEK
jgi:hypothetical protein